MGESPGNIYENKETATAEHRRLQTFEFPSWASQQVLGNDLEGKTVLDLGSGPNTVLNSFISKHGGTYVAFDVNEAFIASQQKGGSLAVRGSIEALPFRESADVVHTRFVLMHLSPEQRTKAIEESVHATRAKAFFLEYDWGTVSGGGEIIDSFKRFAVAFMKDRHIDPFMGATLADTVREALKNETFPITISEKRLNEGPGNYYQEFIPLAKAMREVAISKRQEPLLVELDALTSRLEEEANKETPDLFVRPDIVVVEVTKS